MKCSLSSWGVFLVTQEHLEFKNLCLKMGPKNGNFFWYLQYRRARPGVHEGGSIFIYICVCIYLYTEKKHLRLSLSLSLSPCSMALLQVSIKDACSLGLPVVLTAALVALCFCSLLKVCEVSHWTWLIGDVSKLCRRFVNSDRPKTSLKVP